MNLMIAPAVRKAARADTRPQGSVSYSGCKGAAMEEPRAGAWRRAGCALLKAWVLSTDELRLALPPVVPSGSRFERKHGMPGYSEHEPGCCRRRPARLR